MLKLKNVNCVDPKTQKLLLNNVTFEVREGDYIAVTSQNEKEQETLLQVLGAVRSVKSGEVYIDGIELTKHTPSQLTFLRRGKFGYIFRDSILDEALTVGENVELPLVFAGVNSKEQQEKGERALNIVGLMAFKDLKVSDLTEWQKNKVLIARAIVNEPKVLVVSEPCRVQEKSKLQEVVALLSAINRDGVTVIVASNNDEYVSKAKRRIDIAGGSITEVKKERAPRDPEARKTRTKKSTKTTSKKASKPKLEENFSSVSNEVVPTVDEVKTKKPRVSKTTKSEDVVVDAEPKKRTRKRKSEVENNANVE